MAVETQQEKRARIRREKRLRVEWKARKAVAVLDFQIVTMRLRGQKLPELHVKTWRKRARAGKVGIPGRHREYLKHLGYAFPKLK